MTPVQVWSTPGPFPHHVEWRIVTGLYDTGVKFRLKCANCDASWGDAGFDWIGNDGPPLGKVVRDLARYRAGFTDVGDDCPATVRDDPSRTHEVGAS